MWVVIGMYGGRETYLLAHFAGGRALAARGGGCQALMPGDACTLGKDIIHSVTNPLSKLTSAIHIYAGDFVTQQREQWKKRLCGCGPTTRPTRSDGSTVNQLMGLRSPRSGRSTVIAPSGRVMAGPDPVIHVGTGRSKERQPRCDGGNTAMIHSPRADSLTFVHRFNLVA